MGNPILQRVKVLIIGEPKEGMNTETRRNLVMVSLISLSGLLFIIPFVVLSLLKGHMAHAVVNLLLGTVLGIIYVYTRTRGYHRAFTIVGAMGSACFFAYLLFTGGIDHTGHLWFSTFPVFVFFIMGQRRGAIAVLLLLACAVLFFLFDERSTALYSTSFKIRISVVYLVIALFSFIFERIRERTQGQLAAQNLDLASSIAELKVTSDARRASETVLKATLEATGDGILVVNNAGQVLAANRRFAEIIGQPPESIAAQESALIPAFTEQLTEPSVFTAQIQRLHGTDGTDSDQLHFKDGRVIDRLSAPLLLAGSVEGRVWSFRDITNSTKLQAELQRSQKMEALGTLAGGVAHDLNNILSGVVGYPDLLLADLPADSPLKQDILAIKSSGQRAGLIVQDLLTLARRGVPIGEVLSVNEIIEKYLDSPGHRGLCSRHPQARIETRLSGGLLHIKGSPIHIDKTVMNLITNAVEALPAEGGEITISTLNRYVDTPVVGYDAVKEGEYVLLEVKDTGAGISSRDIEHIFEPFYSSKKMGRSGSGLGMAVVWGTVKDQQGYIDVQSVEGRGTTFTLYFPATREEVEEQREASIETFRGKGEVILIVDDIKEQRAVATRMLSLLKYSVESVSSGEEAIDYLGGHAVDLVILDMIMEPGIDGLDTYRRITEFHPGQRVVIASGYSETDRVKEAQRLGAGPFVRKPYTLETFGLTIKKELSKGRG